VDDDDDDADAAPRADAPIAGIAQTDDDADMASREWIRSLHDAVRVRACVVFAGNHLYPITSLVAFVCVYSVVQCDTSQQQIGRCRCITRPLARAPTTGRRADRRRV